MGVCRSGGYGLTNLVARPTPGIDTLEPAEYLAGLRILRRKVRRWQPGVVALLGVTLYRLIAPARVATPFTIGWQTEPFEGARLSVLPNPSGRNAHYSYAELLDCYRSLAEPRLVSGGAGWSGGSGGTDPDSGADP